jgi:hypothetical protein
MEQVLHASPYRLYAPQDNFMLSQSGNQLSASGAGIAGT